MKPNKKLEKTSNLFGAGENLEAFTTTTNNIKKNKDL